MQLDPTDLKISEYRGGIALVGDALENAFQHFAPGPRPSHPLHITLLTAAEVRSLKTSQSFSAWSLPYIPLSNVYALGTASRRNVSWITVLWNHADVYRRTLGLSKKDYHITLTDEDDHGVAKGMSSLLKAMPADKLVERISPIGESALDHAFLASDDENFKRLAAEAMISAFPDSYKGYARLASVAEPKIACLAYARAATLNPGLLSAVGGSLRKLRDQASYGPVVTAAEAERIPPELLTPWSDEIHDIVRVLWTHPTASRERQIFADYSLPRFFSWLFSGRVAGMSTPRNQADVDALASMGITHVLTLTAEEPLDPSWFQFGIQHVYVPVPNYQPPTIAEMDAIFAQVNVGGSWLIHCGGGVGRAGTVLACIVAMWGREGTVQESLEPQLDAGTAIRLVRHARPRSLETEAQERFVTAWVSHRWKIAHTGAASIPEPYDMLSVEGDLKDSVTHLFLVGRPGSGKSWFASALAKRRKITIVSQDESGSRAFCEKQISRAPLSDTLVILDRCNPSASDRKHWLSLVSGRCVAVYFDYPPELCAQRINARLSHPTLRAGRGGNALSQMDRDMEKPQLQEGFAAVLTIPSFPAAREAIIKLSGYPPLLKFPRTPHLINLGAAGDDDIVQADFDTLKGTLVVEEKIDGANMGISLDWDGALRVQNRSHWVSSADHAQFRPLDSWIRTHDAALRQILDRDPEFPERYILYGEWMVAKHSIHYTSLPGHFIAFDLYDRLNGFLSRGTLQRALKGTGIPQVALLQECSSLSRDQILSLIQQKSAYGDSRVEGIYVRCEDPARTKTLSRAKVVRGDFISGNQHWARGPLTLNGVPHR